MTRAKLETNKNEVHKVSGVRFLGEQTGPTEKLLTDKLSQIFASNGLILRAYLVRASYATKPDALNVVLALLTKTGREEPTIVREIGATFASFFGRTQHLDILFIRTDQERGVESVCPAFYRALEGTESHH
jgi:hypothetical protein